MGQLGFTSAGRWFRKCCLSKQFPANLKYSRPIVGSEKWLYTPLEEAKTAWLFSFKQHSMKFTHPFTKLNLFAKLVYFGYKHEKKNLPSFPLIY